MKIMFCFIVFILALNTGYQPKTGDLLFQDIDCGPLCDAIETVTAGIDGAKFSHVGIVVVTDSGNYVLEAISAGVKFTPYPEFLARSTDSLDRPKVIVGRLKNKYQSYIAQAVSNMEKYLGKTYDTVFSIDNDAYYCSELIYAGFKEATGDPGFFRLDPMTFKAPGENTYFPAWKKYFEDLGVKIPENEPGLNPGGISKSDKIEIVHVFGFPDGYKPKILPD
jgi:hypothetical protein